MKDIYRGKSFDLSSLGKYNRFAEPTAVWNAILHAQGVDQNRILELAGPSGIFELKNLDPLQMLLSISPVGITPHVWTTDPQRAEAMVYELLDRGTQAQFNFTRAKYIDFGLRFAQITESGLLRIRREHIKHLYQYEITPGNDEFIQKSLFD